MPISSHCTMGWHDVNRAWLTVILVKVVCDGTVVSFAGLVLGNHHSVQPTFKGQ